MAEPTQLQKLVQFTIKERDFREVCDFMHLPPRDVEALIVEARAQGHEIDVRGHSIRVALAEDRQVDLGLKPEAKSYAIGAMGDLHAGSRYCRWDAVKDYVHHAYEKHGVRDIFQAGDLTEGIYRHASFERSNEGIEDQTAEMAEHLPKLKGLTYHAITGNHDITWMEKAGISPGKDRGTLAYRRLLSAARRSRDSRRGLAGRRRPVSEVHEAAGPRHDRELDPEVLDHVRGLDPKL
jgi:hypothetical protein